MKFFTALNPHKRKAGFTLIELMVVIAIIGILASIVTVSLVSARAKGRDAKRVADIRTVQLALEQYYNDNGYYPVSISASLATYLSTVPKDPKDNTTAYSYSSYNTSTNPTGMVNCLSKATSYHLAAVMESDDSTNPALKQDSDWTQATWTVCSGSTANFSGNAASCSGTTAAFTDPCYDQVN